MKLKSHHIIIALLVLGAAVLLWKGYHIYGDTQSNDGTKRTVRQKV